MGRRPPAARRGVQQELQAARGTYGGPRAHSGRKRGRRTTVERVERAPVRADKPCHVTLKLRAGAPPLRRHHTYRTLRAVFRRGKDRFGFRLVHFSVQSNHVHLICEADDNRALARGMQGLAVRVARRLNRAAGRTGSLFADRYHLHVLSSPREVRNCLVYVLRNGVRHGVSPSGAIFDVYSSAMYFDGWSERPRVRLVDDGERPVVPARAWLLTAGWRRAGAISIDDAPA
jgi:REP element-mobilizing transposase RayT